MTRDSYFFEEQLPPKVRSAFLWEMLANAIAAFYIPVLQQYFLTVAIQQGVSNLQAGLISSAASIGLLFSFIWTPFMQGRRKTPFMVWGGVITRSVFALVSFLSMGWFSTFVFILINIGASLTLPAYVDILGRIYPEKLRGKLLGYQRIILSVLLITMTFVVGQILDSHKYHRPFFIAALLGALGSLTLIKMGEPEVTTEDAPVKKETIIWRQFSEFKQNPAFRWFSIICFLFGFGYMFGIPLYFLFQVKVLGLSNTEVGYIRVVFFVAWMVGFWMIGKLVKWFTLIQMLAADIVLFSLLPLCYLLGGNFAAAMVGAAVQGIAEAVFEIVFLMYLMRDSKITATLVGLSYALIGLRGAIAPAVSSALLSSLGYNALFGISVAATLLGLVFVRKLTATAFEARRDESLAGKG